MLLSAKTSDEGRQTFCGVPWHASVISYLSSRRIPLVCLEYLCPEGVIALNLREYRESIPMQVWEFARRVDVDDKAIRNAKAGDRISAAISREIARVLS